MTFQYVGGKKQDKIQVRLNIKERRLLEEIKELLDCPYDSTVIKMALPQFLNVLQAQLGVDNIRYLVSKKRNRLADGNLHKFVDLDPNVPQN